MRRQFLATWIALCLLGGVIGASSRPTTPTALDVAADRGATTTTTERRPRVEVAAPTTAPSTTPPTTTSTTTAGPPSTVDTTAPPTTPAPPVAEETAPPEAPAPTGPGAHGDGPGLYLVAADGSSARRVVDRCADGMADWIDGGRAWVQRSSTGFVVRGLDGSEQRVEVPGPVWNWTAGATGRTIAAAWDPGGSVVVSIFHIDSGQRVDVYHPWAGPIALDDGTYLLTRWPGEARVVDEAGTVVRDWFPMGVNYGMEIGELSPSRRSVLAPSPGGPTYLAVADLATGATTPLPGAPVTGIHWLDDDHLVGSDGGAQVGDPNRVLRVDIRSGEQTTIASGGGFPLPRTSTGEVVFASHRPFGQLDVVDRDGGGRRPFFVVGDGHRMSALAWSPDQTQVLVSVCDASDPSAGRA